VNGVRLSSQKRLVCDYPARTRLRHDVKIHFFAAARLKIVNVGNCVLAALVVTCGFFPAHQRNIDFGSFIGMYAIQENVNF
jgi:hypothetical protein